MSNVRNHGDRDLVDYIGVPALLEQLAEECNELGFAALKYARFLRGENKVHGATESDLLDHLVEEIADVRLTIQEIVSSEIIDESDIDQMYDYKYDRMNKRLEQEDLKDVCANSESNGYIIQTAEEGENIGLIFDDANAQAFADAGYFVTDAFGDKLEKKEKKESKMSWAEMNGMKKEDIKKKEPDKNPVGSAVTSAVADAVSDFIMEFLKAMLTTDTKPKKDDKETKDEVK